MISAYYKRYEIHFKVPAGTSRGIYTLRKGWYLFFLEDGKTGIGECGPLPGLSRETTEEVEKVLSDICLKPEKYIENPDLLRNISSVRFAFEVALTDLRNGGNRILFPSSFTLGKGTIPINGLIWMDTISKMQEQIKEKLKAGFHCIKIKIGHKDFDEEMSLLHEIRETYSFGKVTLRVDANGAFNSENIFQKLKKLESLDIHSIEQPVMAGKWDLMEQICKKSTVPIALDEELIGVNDLKQKKALLDKICPAYLVLKPSLHGGIAGCEEWIHLAEERSIGWWITSYLETNIGLNAIAQWTYTKSVRIPQGLGTGKLFTDNIPSPLKIRNGNLEYDPLEKFGLPGEKQGLTYGK